MTVSNVDKKSVTDEDPVRLCNYTDVYYNDVITDGLPLMEATASREQIRRFGLRAGDVLITKDSETPEDIGVPAFVPRSIDGVLCGYHLAVVRARPDRLVPKYLFWALQASATRSQLCSATTGVTRFGLRSGSIRELEVPVPSLELQFRVAAFLDTETTRIDALVEERSRMVGLLQDRVWSQFVEAVREGRTSPVPLRRALLSICDGPFGSTFSSTDYSTDGAFVVRLGNIGFAEFRRESSAFIPLELYTTLQRHRVLAGDLLIAGLGDDRNHAGRACVAPDLGPAIVKGKCFAARVNTVIANPAFLALFLSSPVGADLFSVEGRGSTRTMINLDLTKSVRIPLPSVAAQTAIVRLTRESRRRARATIEAVTRQIAVLKERRQALITAAVTGELDVTKGAA